MLFCSSLLSLQLLFTTTGPYQLRTREGPPLIEASLGIPIQLQHVQFTGSPVFDENGVSSIPPRDPKSRWPENATYFGEASKSMDEVWHKLTKPFEFALSEAEAKSIWGDRYTTHRDPRDGRYMAGCLSQFTLSRLRSSSIRSAAVPFNAVPWQSPFRTLPGQPSSDNSMLWKHDHHTNIVQKRIGPWVY
ncbi:hypothetical protein NA57DRAFT_60885 [Rhizodiscina lignyota]|uniref:Uncharacterized protein n=1 Tax=Rhizodiscina lignyota TaxID=1504668 RepID=A0A9P4I7B9_9PEZI|nr:hypothetical protein NA57DRAFT_60885 [Rhizodiscina lignyota]